MAYSKPNNSLDADQIQELLSQKNFTQAESLIRGHLQAHPKDADAHYQLGVWHYFQGQIPQTIDSMRRALSLNPNHTDAAVCLSVLLNDLGKYDDAKRVLSRRINRYPPTRVGTIGASIASSP